MKDFEKVYLGDAVYAQLEDNGTEDGYYLRLTTENGLYELAPLPSALASCATGEANRYYSPVRYPEKAPNELAILSSRPSRDFYRDRGFPIKGRLQATGNC